MLSPPAATGEKVRRRKNVVGGPGRGRGANHSFRNRKRVGVREGSNVRPQKNPTPVKQMKLRDWRQCRHKGRRGRRKKTGCSEGRFRRTRKGGKPQCARALENSVKERKRSQAHETLVGKPKEREKGKKSQLATFPRVSKAHAVRRTGHTATRRKNAKKQRKKKSHCFNSRGGRNITSKPEERHLCEGNGPPPRGGRGQAGGAAGIR